MLPIRMTLTDPTNDTQEKDQRSTPRGEEGLRTITDQEPMPTIEIPTRINPLPLRAGRPPKRMVNGTRPASILQQRT